MSKNNALLLHTGIKKCQNNTVHASVVDPWPLTYGTCSFRQRPARCQQKIIFSSKFLWLLLFLGTFTSFSKDKSHKEVTKEYKSRFFFLFLFEDGRMRIRIRKDNDGSGPWRPKNIGILRIRVRNTACLRYQKWQKHKCTLACDRIIFWSFPHSAVKTVWISWLSARPVPYGDRPPHHWTPPHRPSPHSRSRSHCSSLRNHSPPHSQSFLFLGARLSTSPKIIHFLWRDRVAKLERPWLATMPILDHQSPWCWVCRFEKEGINSSTDFDTTNS